MKAIFPDHLTEQLIGEFFRGVRSGFYVDVGANEPYDGSQTWRFEQLGWNGVLVEPQPDLAERLRQGRRAKVYAVACSSPDNTGKSMTLNVAGIHSSLVQSHFVAGMRHTGSITVPVKTLDEILADANAPAPVDFISIDVEQHEIEVLSGFDLKQWRPRLILIEDLVFNLRIHRYLTARGYRWVRRTGINAWYVPADTPIDVGSYGRLQFLRKYYAGTPFRVLREWKRRQRAIWFGR